MKSFTKREKAMLIVLGALIIGAAYYFLFFQPVQVRIEEAQARTAEAVNNQLIEQARAVKYNQMKKEIEEMKAKGAAAKSEVPDYNNLRSVMVQLDGILSIADSYEIGFADLSIGERTITRPVSISFTAPNYQTAKTIIQSLADCHYRCTVDGVDLADDKPDSKAPNVRTNAVEVRVSINFYERNTLPKPVVSVEEPAV